MFKKHPYLKIECLPGGKFLLQSNINKNTNPSDVANFINELLTRELLDEFMEGMYNCAIKNGAEDIAEEICNKVFDVQKEFRITPVVYGRNPIIKPSGVMKQPPIGVTNE